MYRFIVAILLIVNSMYAFGQSEQEAYINWGNLIYKGGNEFNKGNLAEAMEIFQEAFLEISKFGPTPSLASTFSAQANVERARGNLQEASRLFTNAVAMYQKSGAPVRKEVIDDLISLSTVELELENYDKAETYVSLAYKLATNMDPGPNKLTIEVIELFQRVLFASGKTGKSKEIGDMLNDFRSN